MLVYACLLACLLVPRVPTTPTIPSTSVSLYLPLSLSQSRLYALSHLTSYHAISPLLTFLFHVSSIPSLLSLSQSVNQSVNSVVYGFSPRMYLHTHLPLPACLLIYPLGHLPQSLEVPCSMFLPVSQFVLTIYYPCTALRESRCLMLDLLVGRSCAFGISFE